MSLILLLSLAAALSLLGLWWRRGRSGSSSEYRWRIRWPLMGILTVLACLLVIDIKTTLPEPGPKLIPGSVARESYLTAPFIRWHSKTYQVHDPARNGWLITYTSTKCFFWPFPISSTERVPFQDGYIAPDGQVWSDRADAEQLQTPQKPTSTPRQGEVPSEAVEF